MRNTSTSSASVISPVSGGPMDISVEVSAVPPWSIAAIAASAQAQSGSEPQASTR